MTQTAYRQFQLDPNPLVAGANAAAVYLTSLATREAKVSAYPGKRLFGAFVEALQEDYGVNIRLDDIVAEITENNAPEELKQCLDKLNSI